MKKYVLISGFIVAAVCSFASTDSLMKSYKSSKKDTVLFNRIFSDSKDLRSLGRYDDALIILTLSKKWVFTEKSIRHHGSWYFNNGLTYDYSGIFDSAFVNYNKALPYFIKIGKKYYEAQVYSNMGIAYLYKGESKNALKELLKALKISERYKYDDITSTVTTNLGGIYFNLGDYDKAYRCFMKQINKGNENNQGVISSSYYNIGMIHFKRNQLDSSEYYLDLNYSMSEKLNDKMSMADALAGLGAVKRRQGKYDEAADNYQRSMKLMHELDATMSYHLYLNASLLYAQLQNKKLALAYHDTAVMIANKSPSMEKKASIVHSLAQVYGSFGDYKNAYSELLKYTELNDSIYSDANTKEIENLKMEHDLEKKENEVKLNEKIKREKQKAKLEAEAAAQDKRNKSIIIGVVAFAILIVVFALIVYRRFQISKKQNRIIELQKKEVMHQKEIVEEKNKEIVDSINYAKRLQEAILPSEKNWFEQLPESFIFYKPKDIVAGDFYWLDVMEKNGAKNILFAAADCTGHGVPGALVSVVCSNALNRSVNEFGMTDPGKILDKTTDLVIETFIKSGSEVKDGMDISLVSLSYSALALQWSGANNPLWIIRSGELLEWKADKQPVGMYFDRKEFTTHSVEIQKGDLIYVFSDGYGDQFGGERKKKFKESSMKKLLLANWFSPMNEQKKILEREFRNWKGDLEQIDDVCVIGVKI